MRDKKYIKIINNNIIIKANKNKKLKSIIYYNIFILLACVIYYMEISWISQEYLWVDDDEINIIIFSMAIFILLVFDIITINSYFNKNKLFILKYNEFIYNWNTHVKFENIISISKSNIIIKFIIYDIISIKQKSWEELEIFYNYSWLPCNWDKIIKILNTYKNNNNL